MRRLPTFLGLVIVSATLAASASAASAQELEVRGTVTLAPDGSPLEGVSVQLKGTNLEVRTDANGEYRIDAGSTADTLIFNSLGFAEQRVGIADQSVVDVSLQQAALDLGDLVVIGYERSDLGVVTYERPPTPNCDPAPEPMPGSVYDPNWQRANPELAKLILGECAGLGPGAR